MNKQLPGGSSSSKLLSMIQLRGVRVHNLKNIDLDIPLNQLTVVCGVSGSGKTSLAFDTLYAEGQRRYIETLSPSARQFLNQFPKPEADHITNVPPAIALRQDSRKNHSSGRGIEPTVAITSGIQHYLRLLYVSSGQVVCPGCQSSITPQSPESALSFLKSLSDNTKFQICYPIQKAAEETSTNLIQDLIHQGMTRVIANNETVNLTESLPQIHDQWDSLLVVLDRLNTKVLNEQRVLDSLELAFEKSPGQATILVEQNQSKQKMAVSLELDRKKWFRYDFSIELICHFCQKEFILPEPQLFNYYSPTGACPVCEGSGITSDPQNHAMDSQICPACDGSRLNPAALAVQIQNHNINQLCRLPIPVLLQWLQDFTQDLKDSNQDRLSPVLREINDRLSLLSELGVSYLTLNRSMISLSGGESQRIALVSLLSSNLVNTLYILDEPSSGLHNAENHRVITVLKKLRDLKNTLVVVEHDTEFIQAADHIVELGPAAGKAGGEIIFEGSYQQLLSSTSSPTNQFLKSTSASVLKSQSRIPDPQLITLTGVTRNHLKNITVSFPLKQLCVVTGLSGSGKSSLIEQTLFPVLCDILAETTTQETFRFCQSAKGAGQIDEVILLDQSLIGQTPRSIPATYLNLFDDIRAVFAQTTDAKLRNLSPTHFSFNSKNGGRCPECKGTGFTEVDLQFLADLTMVCQECHGKRYQRELLEIKYRKLDIAEVLELTVDEAFPFFRGQPALQKKMKRLKDVGLGYLTLGQPVSSLSGGESQRLKLAAYLTTSSRSQTLFLMNEPTCGLHPLDIQQVLNCFDHLLMAGHSIIIIEHNLDIICVADHIIDLGPEAGKAGGNVVATGTPEEIAQHSTSYTGAVLKKLITAN
ncbi:MAG: excinuclease ABC subunit UvrA [Planctomycetes bacterium]|nr:excinuclease ABC subunit UvrA [Planctomycetota bacterium]MCH9725163.1 excinuclease ABC subunit UvrA [Planctomycetota bacterium]MCH9775366.1 excinuclease ABC subunit UvrA [Planctomycetota bacterium]